jgi:hypothetical protein
MFPVFDNSSALRHSDGSGGGGGARDSGVASMDNSYNSRVNSSTVSGNVAAMLSAVASGGIGGGASGASTGAGGGHVNFTQYTPPPSSQQGGQPMSAAASLAAAASSSSSFSSSTSAPVVQAAGNLSGGSTVTSPMRIPTASHKLPPSANDGLASSPLTGVSPVQSSAMAMAMSPSTHSIPKILVGGITNASHTSAAALQQQLLYHTHGGHSHHTPSGVLQRVDSNNPGHASRTNAEESHHNTGFSDPASLLEQVYSSGQQQQHQQSPSVSYGSSFTSTSASGVYTSPRRSTSNVYNVSNSGLITQKLSASSQSAQQLEFNRSLSLQSGVSMDDNHGGGGMPAFPNYQEHSGQNAEIIWDCLVEEASTQRSVAYIVVQFSIIKDGSS